jgi:hypothetical protein
MIAALITATVLAGASATHIVRVDVTPGHAVNSFDPLRTIGAGIDSQTTGDIARIYQPGTIAKMLSSGLGPVSYRLYTELSVQHWHWNPVGSWSSPAGDGYWTGSTKPGKPIVNSFGYRLPHRGFTHDQGNDDDYSRLDDGDLATYWKSNPYLTEAFTHEPDALHPQWIVIDLGKRKPVDAIRIAWTAPYAVAYQVQYWRGDDAIYDPANGRWVTFPGGMVTDGTGGTAELRLSKGTQDVEFVRVLMTRSSDTCDTHGSSDIRNCVGYAVDEVYLGSIDADGNFKDLIIHHAYKTQTTTYASSVDPWHAPVNRVTDQEQPGLDIVYSSGITRGLPAMVAVGMLYGTPDDAAAEIEYLEARGDPISYVELGEEPDGQFVLPEDDAALYVQWAAAIHAVDPKLHVGGPVFQGATSDIPVWPDANGDTSWFNRFLKYLASHGDLSDLQFMSFEHYPFDPCDRRVAQDLIDEPSVMRGIMQTWVRDGLPSGVPMFVTEANFSANSAEEMQDISGGLWLADWEGSFLAAGGSGAYLYQYEPDPLVSSSSQCTSYGAWGMWASDYMNRIRQPASQYFVAQMVTQDWAQPVDAVQSMYPAETDVLAPLGKQIVTAYALNRPDGRWSVMLVNKDPANAYVVAVHFHNGATGKSLHFAGSIATVLLGPAQYRWHRDGIDGYADPDGPALTGTAPGGANATYDLPAASVTVLRGTISP